MALQYELERQGNWLFRHRGALPLIILAAGIGVYLYEMMMADHHPTPARTFMFEIACLLITFLGLSIRCYTVGYTPANTSGRNTEQQVADVLNTTGIYSLVRHPLYLANFIMWLGIALVVGNLWFVFLFCLLFMLYYERIMFAEEQFLRSKFGEDYDFWAGTIPAFIPSLTRIRFSKSSTLFSWKKVLKKEKTGLMAMFVVFALLNIVRGLVWGKNYYNYYIIITACAVLLFYCVLKCLDKYTSFLNEAGR